MVTVSAAACQKIAKLDLNSSTEAVGWNRKKNNKDKYCSRLSILYTMYGFLRCGSYPERWRENAQQMCLQVHSVFGNGSSPETHSFPEGVEQNAHKNWTNCQEAIVHTHTHTIVLPLLHKAHSQVSWQPSSKKGVCFRVWTLPLWVWVLHLFAHQSLQKDLFLHMRPSEYLP